MLNTAHPHHSTIEDVFSSALFAKLVLLSENDADGAPVLARKVGWRVSCVF